MKLQQTSVNSSQIQGLATLCVLSLNCSKLQIIKLCWEVQQETRLVSPFWSEYNIMYWTVDQSLTKLNFSQDGTDICRGRLDDFGTILSPAFRAATVFVGIAVIISILCIISFILFFMCRYLGVVGVVRILSRGRSNTKVRPVCKVSVALWWWNDCILLHNKDQPWYQSRKLCACLARCEVNICSRVMFWWWFVKYSLFIFLMTKHFQSIEVQPSYRTSMHDWFPLH